MCLKLEGPDWLPHVWKANQDHLIRGNVNKQTDFLASFLSQCKCFVCDPDAGI